METALFQAVWAVVVLKVAALVEVVEAVLVEAMLVEVALAVEVLAVVLEVVLVVVEEGVASVLDLDAISCIV